LGSIIFTTRYNRAAAGVINDLVISFNLNESALSHLTSAVQFGFIIGTFISPSKVFFISALLGSLFNLGIIWEANSLFSLLSLRFFTGFFLAGIYPVGM
jgi:MFS family permease